MQKENERQPYTIENLAEFKRLIVPGTELMATAHANHPEMVGLVRVVTEVQSNAFYSVIKDQPEHRWSTCNYGKGFRTDFGKARDYIFGGTTVKMLDTRKNDGSILCEYDNRHTIPENGEELDYEGRVLIFSADSMHEDHLHPEEQLFLAQGGFGCRPNARGTKIFGQFLCDGEKCHISRMDVVGAIRDECLPDWEREKFENIGDSEDEGMVMS